ncbi:hypothetical protein SAMN03159363_4001 [Variovorax sp. EL159]|nr:hypothetical protein SAMN03159363_4001 [Variovorax sp. EL159]
MERYLLRALQAYFHLGSKLFQRTIELVGQELERIHFAQNSQKLNPLFGACKLVVALNVPQVSWGWQVVPPFSMLCTTNRVHSIRLRVTLSNDYLCSLVSTVRTNLIVAKLEYFLDRQRS